MKINFFLNLFDSLKFGDQGYSNRKLIAVAISTCVVAIHAKYIALGDFDQLEMVLGIDYAFIAGLVGMTTYQAIQQHKINSNSDKNENKNP